MGNAQAIRSVVQDWCTVHQEHVVVGAISGNVVDGDVPAIEFAGMMEWDSLPVSESSGHFDAGGVFCMAIGEAIAEDLGEDLFWRAVLRGL